MIGRSSRHLTPCPLPRAEREPLTPTFAQRGSDFGEELIEFFADLVEFFGRQLGRFCPETPTETDYPSDGCRAPFLDWA